MTNQQFENRIVKLTDLDRRIKELEAEKELIKQDVISHMESEKIETPRFKLAYQTVRSTRFDSKALKEADPFVYALYSKETESKRFTYSLEEK